MMSVSEFIFDAHAHILTDDIAAYPPSPISGRLRPGVLDNPMTAERLIEAMDANHVKRAALIQRAHIYGYDNSYVIDAAARFADRFYAICVIDSIAPDAAAKAAEWLDRGAVGIRLTEPARGADGTWLNGAEARKVWEAVSQRGGSISIQLYTWNRLERMPEIPPLAADFGSTPIIVEHLSNITETVDPPEYGVDAALDALADLDNVILKLTTINLGRCRTNHIDARPLIARVASKFPDRLIWGSDVGQSPDRYEDMIAMALEAVEGLHPDQRSAVICGAAERLFVR